jgi:hypothetical protein
VTNTCAIRCANQIANALAAVSVIWRVNPCVHIFDIWSANPRVQISIKKSTSNIDNHNMMNHWGANKSGAHNCTIRSAITPYL